VILNLAFWRAIVSSGCCFQVEFETEENDALKVTVRVPAQRCDEAYNTVIAELRKDYQVPGFRNNEKVPVDMLIQAAGGERQVKFACLEQVMHMTISEVRSQLLVSFMAQVFEQRLVSALRLHNRQKGLCAVRCRPSSSVRIR
jgi:FKBP-type peptidyl-prolyl cis-trans isomerase (trigger factor)